MSETINKPAKITKKSETPKSLLLTNNTTKLYSLINTKCTKYLSNWYDNGIVKQVNFNSINSNNLDAMRVFATHFDIIEGYLKWMQNSPPIDCRLIIDNIEVTDQVTKAIFMQDIIMVEQRSSSHITLIPLVKDALRVAKTEAVAKAKVGSMIAALQRKLPTLSMPDCRKVQQSLEQI